MCSNRVSTGLWGKGTANAWWGRHKIQGRLLRAVRTHEHMGQGVCRMPRNRMGVEQKKLGGGVTQGRVECKRMLGQSHRCVWIKWGSCTSSQDKGKLYSYSSGGQHRPSDRTLATQRGGRWEDSWKLLEQSTPGKMENNVDHRDVKETDEVSEPHSKRLLFSWGQLVMSTRNTPPVEIRCSGLTAVATRCLYSFVHGRSKEGCTPLTHRFLLCHWVQLSSLSRQRRIHSDLMVYTILSPEWQPKRTQNFTT